MVFSSLLLVLLVLYYSPYLMMEATQVYKYLIIAYIIREKPLGMVTVNNTCMGRVPQEMCRHNLSITLL